MSGNNKKSTIMTSTNKKREELSSKTYTVERLLKHRKRKGRIEYLVKWKHYDRNHNSWEPEANILDKSLIDSYKKQTKSSLRRTLSPKKSAKKQNNDLSPVKNESVPDDNVDDADDQLEKEDIDRNKQEKIINSTTIDYWYPPICAQKAKIAITDITSDDVTITFRELI